MLRRSLEKKTAGVISPPLRWDGAFSEESFMKWAYRYLDEGKIRASYGVTGNDRIGAYDAIRSYTFGSSDDNGNGNWYNGISGVAPSATFGNPALSWEETKQTNIGVRPVVLTRPLNHYSRLLQ